jgi:hypothetical protein
VPSSEQRRAIVGHRLTLQNSPQGFATDPQTGCNPPNAPQ